MGSYSHTDSPIAVRIWSRLLCSISPEKSVFFDTYVQYFNSVRSDPVSPSFSSFHIAQATLLTILTTQEKHGGWYYLNKENCNSPKDCLFVIFLDLKLLPSVPFEALSLPATDTNTNSTFGAQWMEIQPAHSFLSSAQVKLLA